MKIAILVGGLPPIYNGGTEIATVQTAIYAARAGHDVTVIAADGSGRGETAYRELENGFVIRRVRTAHPPYWHGLTYIPQATAIIARIKPDLIHAQALYTAAAGLAAHLATGIPYIVYERGGLYLDWFAKRQTVQILLNSAKRAIAQTEAMRTEMLKYVSRPVEVIPNGIDASRFGILTKRRARRDLGMLHDRKIVISVGNCRPEKNMRGFVMAALEDKTDAVYLLAGAGEQLADLERLGRERVRFLGLVPNDEIPAYLATADVMVNTSFSEGFPMSVLEGMAAGLPIIAPRVCGLPEIVENGVNGILTEPGDYKSTAAAIQRILKDDNMALQMGVASRKKAEGYTWESVVEKLYGQLETRSV